MELRQLEHFLAVAAHASFTAAAQEATIVQSALSTSIRNLERELGGPLFERTTRRVVLTEAGRTLLPTARRMLADSATAKDSVAAVLGVRAGRVNVGTIQTLSHVDLPAELAKFHQAHPDVRIHVHDTTVDELTEALRVGELDLAYLVFDEEPRGLAIHQQHEDRLVVVGGPNHPFRQRGEVTLQEVSREPLIGFGPGTALAKRTARLFSERGLHAQLLCQTTQLDFQLSLVRNELGVAIVTSTRAERAGMPYAVLIEPRADWIISLASRQPRPTNPAAAALLDQLLTDAPISRKRPPDLGGHPYGA